jgi:hypothetical protein
LTAAIGLALLVLTVVELGTLVLGLQRFLSWHVFVGIVLLPPIAFKLSSTGWRFMRYYAGAPDYVQKGPPHVVMRVLAPMLVAFTALLFGSGVAMGFVHGHVLALARRVHGPAAFGWTVVVGAHVLVHLRRALRARRIALVAATLVAGLAVGAATLPVQDDWLHLPRAFDHDRGQG